MTASTDCAAPPHPGSVLKEGFLARHGLSIMAAAGLLRVTRQQLHRVATGASSVSPEMAVRLGKLFGNGGMFWLDLQADHDLWHASRRMESELDLVQAGRKDAASRTSPVPEGCAR